MGKRGRAHTKIVPKSCRIAFRVTPVQFDKIVEHAGTLSLSEFARRKALSLHIEQRPPLSAAVTPAAVETEKLTILDYRQLVAALAEASRQLARVGNNLNQLSKRANATGFTPAIRELERTTSAIRDVAAKIADKLTS